MADIKYTIVDGFDHIFDEKGNTFLAMRKLTWGDSDKPKLDIRKYYMNANGEETIGKGLSFLTDEGPHELTRVLLSTGYGRTDEVIESIKNREDFMPSLQKVLSAEQLEEINLNPEQNDYYDPKECLLL